jgi:hypothetical protein
MCSHYYVAYPPFEVVEDDENERALRIAARTSSGRDLVEEFIGYGVWPLVHGWALGEVCPREMPSLGGRKVRSPLFALDVRGGILPRLCVRRRMGWCELLGATCQRRRPRGRRCRPPWEKQAAVTEDNPALEATPATKKRKLGTAMGELGVSDSFDMELMGTCAAPGGRMSSLELRESSARMLEVTGGRWPKNVPIPRAAGEDFFTSRMARDLRVFPYGQNIAAVVSAVMNKDRQDAAQKRRAVIRLPDARHEAKRARGSVKAAIPGGSQPTLAAKPAAPGSSKVPESMKAVGAGGTKSAPDGAAKVRELPSLGKRVADFGTNISVDDYLVGKRINFFLTGGALQGRARGKWLLSRLRWQPRRQPRWLG